jgi:hypothetical protein
VAGGRLGSLNKAHWGCKRGGGGGEGEKNLIRPHSRLIDTLTLDSLVVMSTYSGSL